MHRLTKYVKWLTFSLLLTISFLAGAQQTPIPEWVKDIGGNGESKVTGIGIDKFDNVYVSGNFTQTITVDNSGISAPVTLTSRGEYDIFIAKYTIDGKLLWAKSIGGNGLDQANNLHVDEDGNLYVAAFFMSSDMDCDPGPMVNLRATLGGQDGLLVKFNTDGDFLWSRVVAGPDLERGHVVTTDKAGNVIFIGGFSSPTIALGDGKVLNNKGMLDGFMIKYDKDGNVIFARVLGSVGDDEVRAAKVNDDGTIVIGGYFDKDIDLNPGGAANVMTAGPQPDNYVAKYDAGGMLLWANKIDGTQALISSLAIGPTGGIYVTGDYFRNISFISPSATLTLPEAVSTMNVFIVKYGPNGNALWAREAAASVSSTPHSYYITADVDDNTYIGGYFDGSLTFGNPAGNKIINTTAGSRDTFFARYSGTGDLGWAFNIGSQCYGNFGHKIAVDSKKNVLLGGAFCRTVDFNVGTCELKLTAKNGASDGFISKFNQTVFSVPEITSAAIADQVGPSSINLANRTVKILLKRGTDLTKLTPKILTDAGVLSPLSDTEVDLSHPKPYTITANCIAYNWTVEAVTEIIERVSLCSEVPAKFTVFQEPGATYQWQLFDGTNWISAPGIANTFEYQFPGLVNHTDDDILLKYRATITVLGVDYYIDYQATIHPITIDNNITAAQLMFCNGKANVVITGNTPTGAANVGFTYQWQQSLNGIDWTVIQGAAAKDLAPQEFYKTTYFKRLTIVGLCEAISNVVQIEVYLPTIANAGPSVFLCETRTVTLTANAVQANETGTWAVLAPAGYQPFDAASVHDPVAVIRDLPPGKTVRLQWAIKNNSCNTTTYSEVEFSSFENTVEVSQTLFCTGVANVMIIGSNATDSAIPFSYKWESSVNGTSWAVVAGEVSKDLSPDELYTTTYFRRTVSSGTCNSISNVLKIGVYKPTVANAGPSLSFCEVTQIKLQANAVGVNETGSWTVLSPAGYQPFTAANIHDPAAVLSDFPMDQIIRLQWAITNLDCNSTTTSTVEFSSFSDINLKAQQKLYVYPGETVNLGVTATLVPTVDYKFEWINNPGLSGYQTLSPDVKVFQNTDFRLEVSYGPYCLKVLEITVAILRDVDPPNAFSPNNDGVNDLWNIKHIEGYPNAAVYVYNRWGTILYKAIGFPAPWDGKFNGKQVPVGTYYYTIQLNDKKNKVYKGNVTIIH